MFVAEGQVALSRLVSVPAFLAMPIVIAMPVLIAVPGRCRGGFAVLGMRGGGRAGERCAGPTATRQPTGR